MKRSWWLIISLVLLLVLSVVGACAKPAPVTGPGTPQVAPEPTLVPPPGPPPTQTPKSTKVIPDPGEKSIIGPSGSFPAMTLDELIQHSKTILTGKVTDILPARWGKEHERDVIYQDVIIRVQRYLHGPETENVAIRVRGGKVGDTYMICDADPEFTVGEDVLLFLYIPPDGFEDVPDGIAPDSIYKVTASIPGKYTLKGDIAVSYQDEETSISEVEDRIASIRGSE